MREPTPEEIAFGITHEFLRRQDAIGVLMTAIGSQREYVNHQEYCAFAEKMDAEVEKLPDWFLLALAEAISPQELTVPRRA